MRSTFRNEIFDLPRTLRETFEQGKREYDLVIRKTHWGELPKVFTGPPEVFPLADFMAGAFTSLLGGPCSVQSISDASVKTQPKSICFLISNGGDSAELLHLAQAVRAQGGVALALVGDRSDPLLQAVDGAFAVSHEEKLGSVTLSICRQAIAGHLPLLTARTLKRPIPRYAALEKEFAELPKYLEKAFNQHGEGVRSLAEQLAGARNLTIAAGGSYHCSAMSSADLLSRHAGVAASVRQVTEDRPSRGGFERGALVLVLTGSRCRMKKQTLAFVKSAKRAGATVVTLTDGNDPEITRHSEMTLLLPALDEITGAILAHAVMAWIGYEASRLSLVGRKPTK